ncbi:hypothetical protein M9458_006166, partial [Cirrhinus mrigala]
MVPVSPQCPWEIDLLTLPPTYGASGHRGLQRAHLVASTRDRSGAGRLTASKEVSRATRSAVPGQASISGHRASHS